MSVPAVTRRRGMPLAVIAVLLVTWTAGRAAMWESPFPLPDLNAGDLFFAEAKEGQNTNIMSVESPPAESALENEQPHGSLAANGRGSQYASVVPGVYWPGYSALGDRAAIAVGHQYLMKAAFQTDWHSGTFGSGFVFGESSSVAPVSRGASVRPIPAQPFAARQTVSDRWALDVFAFYRAGSGSLSTSQGRIPVYGANQIAANLQYRIAPRSGHYPRAFVRAYHALIADAESELAAGFSARPLGSVPVRVAGEVRAIRGAVGTDIRPAGYAVTEFAPQSLPLGFSLETYAAAGYVGGEAETYFVDGQASLARELVSLDGPGDQPMRLSVGGAAWGGAQEDANRLDVGPTMRLDLSVGKVPARVSVDWRQRVGGDAAPDSGMAATVSTRF